MQLLTFIIAHFVVETVLFFLGGSPTLLDLWQNNSSHLKAEKFKLMGWIASAHLFLFDLSTYPYLIVPAICILSYLYHVRIFMKFHKACRQVVQNSLKQQYALPRRMWGPSLNGKSKYLPQ